MVASEGTQVADVLARVAGTMAEEIRAMVKAGAVLVKETGMVAEGRVV